ncbi:GxxExxY protein [Candidatus Kuenenbacteria bacterium]|nr:GxxExxY protein [Candidatus Kuenenbacteria bacterium]
MQTQKRKISKIAKNMKREELDALSNKIIGIAIDVHKKIGPGFVEKVYQRILEIEFKAAGLRVEREKRIHIIWKNEIVGYQIVDFVIKDAIILETKVTSQLNDLHQAQLLSYLKAADKRLGLLLNFGENVLVPKRVVNNF